MARRPGGSESGRDRGRGDTRAKRDRLQIAQTAARLIAEHGLTDWALAKQKAARQLMLPESAALPSNEEIEDALGSYHSLFDPDAHQASLRAQRQEALAWMTRLAPWDPVLVGGVAAGWATDTQRRPSRARCRRCEGSRDRARKRACALRGVAAARARRRGRRAPDRDAARESSCGRANARRPAQPPAPARRSPTLCGRPDRVARKVGSDPTFV